MEHTANLVVFDWYYKMAGLAMRTVGRTSDSIRLGLERGFDSGEMMDRIYNNQPSGRLGIGWLADAYYLNQIGCKGLRGRKEILKRELRKTIQTQLRDGLQPVILDVAAGPATYLVETLAELRNPKVFAVCRDLDENGLQRGRALAQAHQVDNVRYEIGNALDEASVLAIRPQPTIIIASGFYELINHDSIIQRQMRINRKALAPGGLFIFTTQVNHPQLKLIANALNNREGKPWIMRNRPVGQTERWAILAGFESVRSMVAPHGLYTISIAR
jgi:SAM-dependent methyltransferase